MALVLIRVSGWRRWNLKPGLTQGQRKISCHRLSWDSQRWTEDKPNPLSPASRDLRESYLDTKQSRGNKNNLSQIGCHHWTTGQHSFYIYSPKACHWSGSRNFKLWKFKVIPNHSGPKHPAEANSNYFWRQPFSSYASGILYKWFFNGQ